MISFWSVFSASLWFSVASLLLYILRHQENFLMRYGVVTWSAAVMLAIIRLIVPLDNTHMIVLRSYTVLPALNRVLRHELMMGITAEEILVFLWLAGAIVGIVFLLFGLLRDRRQLQDFPIVSMSPTVQNAILLCGLDKTNVCVTSAVGTPMAIGLLNPTICLPDWEYSETELYWILQHESTHISGHDIWLRLGFLLFRCLFWWNPFVHLGQRSVDDILELRCDKVVLDKAPLSERTKYVEMLRYVAGQIQCRGSSFVGAGAFVQDDKAGILALRAKQALEAPRPYRVTALMAVTLSLTLFVAPYAFILQPAGLPPEMEDGDEIFQISPETSYIQKTPSGDYELWCNGEYAGPISEQALNDELYRKLEVRP